MRWMDITGRKYGRLTVKRLHDKRTHDGKALWECECDCGTAVVTRSTSLKSGNRVQCDECPSIVKLNLAGDVFGRLTVLCEAANKSNGNTQWICRCSCDGKEITVQTRLLTYGKTQSCGCLKSECVEPVGILGLISYYKKNAAKRRGLSWELTLEAARKLFFDNCYYCGNPPSLPFVYTGTKKPVTLIRNGIDRVDNSIGYRTGNVVTCCSQCNYAKREYTYNDFMSMVVRIYNCRGREFLAQQLSKSTHCDVV